MSEAATTSRQLVVFSLGDGEYGLPITQVHEIIRFAEPRPVASDTPWIRGVISLRGRIIPVYDLGARLGVPNDGAAGTKIVIVETDTGMAGIIVDDVEEVLTVRDDQVGDVPAAGSACLEAIAKIDDRLVVLLSADGIVGGTDPSAVAAAA